jgi:hypothetical protein
MATATCLTALGGSVRDPTDRFVCKFVEGSDGQFEMLFLRVFEFIVADAVELPSGELPKDRRLSKSQRLASKGGYLVPHFIILMLRIVGCCIRINVIQHRR